MFSGGGSLDHTENWQNALTSLRICPVNVTEMQEVLRYERAGLDSFHFKICLHFVFVGTHLGAQRLGDFYMMYFEAIFNFNWEILQTVLERMFKKS